MTKSDQRAYLEPALRYQKWKQTIVVTSEAPLASKAYAKRLLDGKGVRPDGSSIGLMAERSPVIGDTAMMRRDCLVRADEGA